MGKQITFTFTFYPKNKVLHLTNGYTPDQSSCNLSAKLILIMIRDCMQYINFIVCKIKGTYLLLITFDDRLDFNNVKQILN